MNRFLYDTNFKFRFGRHLVFFVVNVFAFTTILFVQDNNGNFFETLWLTFVNALFFFSYAYLTIFLLVPEFLLKRKIVWFAILFVLVGVGLSAMKLMVSDRIFYSAISPENIERTGIMNLRYIVVNAKDMTFIVALFSISKYVKDYIYVEKLRSLLESENKVAQRKLFQSQFDPHFLFNTINNLYALSLLSPMKTITVIRHIKIVLNYIIDEIQKESVDVKDEILLAENFIQLEKIRYGERLSVEFNVEGDLDSVKIPPMILFGLIENCFKHGSRMDAGNPWIKVNVRTVPGKVFLSAENSMPKKVMLENGLRNSKNQLVNLQKRLQLIYPPHGYDLNIQEDETTFKVEIGLKEEIGIRKNKYR